MEVEDGRIVLQNSLGICECCKITKKRCEGFYANYGKEELFEILMGNSHMGAEGTF